MDDKNTAFLAALAGLGDTPIPSTRDEAMLAALVDRLAEIAEAASTPELPEVTTSDNGDVLTVVSGEWAKAAPSTELPSLPSEDGEYALTLTISSGTPVLTWESTT